MKVRAFYPAQVVRRLSLRPVESLTRAEAAALDISLCSPLKRNLYPTVRDGVVHVFTGKDIGMQMLADAKASLATLRRKMEEVPPKYPRVKFEGPIPPTAPWIPAPFEMTAFKSTPCSGNLNIRKI